MFSYEYYNMVRIIPFVLDDSSVPERIVKSNRIQYWVLLVINAVVAFIYAITYYFFDVAYFINNGNYSEAIRFGTFSYLALCLLSIISGVYLGLSIYRIKKMITQKEDVVNTTIMTIHAATFTIYMLSTFVSVIILGLDAWG